MYEKLILELYKQYLDLSICNYNVGSFIVIRISPEEELFNCLASFSAIFSFIFSHIILNLFIDYSLQGVFQRDRESKKCTN